MNKPLILVVDDDKELTDQISSVLKDSGKYDVLTTYTAAEAFEALEHNKKFLGTRNKIELILLDIRMPGMSGVEFLEKLRNDYDARLGVIMVTAFDTMDYWADSLFVFGAIDYVKKPFTNKELLATVDRYFVSDEERERMAEEARSHYWKKGDMRESDN